MKILVLIKWSYPPPPPTPIMLTIEPSMMVILYFKLAIVLWVYVLRAPTK